MSRLCGSALLCTLILLPLSIAAKGPKRDSMTMPRTQNNISAEVGVRDHEWPKPFGMNWNTDCNPGLIAQHQYLTSRMILWLNGQVPTAVLQNVAEVSHSGSESGEGSLDSLEDSVSKMEREETYIMPYWNMWSSDFYGWMEELRAQGAYDTLLDLARTYWAHFPLTNYLDYDSNTYPGESEDTDN